MTTKEAIEILEKRADFLAKRIVSENDARGHMMRAELGALRLALKELDVRYKLKTHDACR
jgi:hypothetical protein